MTRYALIVCCAFLVPTLFVWIPTPSLDTTTGLAIRRQGTGASYLLSLLDPWFSLFTLWKTYAIGKERLLPSKTREDLVQVQDGHGFFGYPYHHHEDDDGKNQQQPPIHVSYNHRSIVIDGTPVLLLGGSLHPVRHTRATWIQALDEAVHMGLNLITVYVVWSAHQPFADVVPLDWSLPGSDFVCNNNSKQEDTDGPWTLGAAIHQAAKQRLWVHLRVGPYVCAEVNYGGIPEWVAVDHADMSLRRPNRPWLDAMQFYVQNLTQYIHDQHLWAHQGGNIILAQMENEINGHVNPDTERILWVAPNGTLVDDDSIPGSRRANLQDYTDWCGQLAQRVAPKVVWTMCEGLAADNTIETCNRGDCASWLDDQGGTGRIGVDQPALWTEFEGGFQIWGEEATHPVEYFWGQTGRQYASRALRWMARGGTQ